MKQPFLEVSFRRSRPLAAYLYLPRQPGAKSHRAEEVAPGMVVDFDLEGRPIGIELTAPTRVSLSEINAVLQGLGHSPMAQADLAPLQAAGTTRLVREGDYVAEVEVELIRESDEWSPYLSVADAERLDQVREALRRGDLRMASGLGKVYRLMPISA